MLGLARSFADLGLSSAIVARQIRDHETLSSLYWASLIAGVAMFGIVLALMPLMVRFYRQPELYHIIPWAALSFVIIPIGQQFQMLLQMDLQVERLVKVDVASAVVRAPGRRRGCARRGGPARAASLATSRVQE